MVLSIVHKVYSKLTLIWMNCVKSSFELVKSLIIDYEKKYQNPLEKIANKCSFKTAHSLLVFLKFDSILESCYKG